MIWEENSRFLFRLLASTSRTTISTFRSSSWLSKHFIGYPFVRALGVKAVCSRQVHYAGGVAGRKNAGSGFFVNGNTRKIADFLVESGEGIKKRAFPAVRVANEADMYFSLIQ